MNKIKLGGHQGFIEINLGDTIDWQNEGSISIQSGNYYVKNAEVWVSLDELISLYEALHKAYKTLNGHISFSNLDGTLQFTLQFNLLGQMNCKGSFQEFPSQENNHLKFEFIIDQSHLPAVRSNLKTIVEPYR